MQFYNQHQVKQLYYLILLFAKVLPQEEIKNLQRRNTLKKKQFELIFNA